MIREPATSRFLSTLSLRRATPSVPHNSQPLRISIHALLAESDGPQGCFTLWEVLFLSTLSLRRATSHQACSGNQQPADFYPRSPCGERRSSPRATMHTWKFLSTLSLRRATLYINRAAKTIVFLSTLSLRRATFASPFSIF